MDNARHDGVAARRQFLRRAAGTVLAVGLATALVLWLMVPDVPDRAADAIAAVDNSQKHQLALQRIGGNSMVAAAQFSQWFRGLWHGAQLARTIAVLTLVIAAMFGLASMIEPVDDHTEP